VSCLEGFILKFKRALAMIQAPFERAKSSAD
jgi:hypothetical protein